ncbi:MAG: hypothetical protein G8237_00835 [Magnetococcales bacterium]|nr:hypothetical protein [Magnetococcales bacterium]NGZ04883.1 hypothetical protein [Magnetococcales bacterium]
MRAVKFFVIFGAVMILVGLGALVARLHDRTTSAHNPAPTPDPTLPIEETLHLPTNAQVAQVVGMDAGAVIWIEQPQGAGQLLFFSAQGKLKRRITLTPADPPAAPRSPNN